MMLMGSAPRLRSEFSSAELQHFHVFMDGGIRRGSDIFKVSTALSDHNSNEVQW